MVQGEAKRFLGALRKAALLQGNALLSVARMYAVADSIELQAEVPAAIEFLNEACAASPARCAPLVGFLPPIRQQSRCMT